MSPTSVEIAAHFAAMDNAALLTLAKERDDLTVQSEHLLLAELARRHLPPPPLTPHPLPHPNQPAYDAQTWVTVERFRDLSSGIVARGALQAAAIPCFLRDENTVRLDWQISNFIGGMRLQVPAPEVDNAREILAGLVLTDEPASDTGIALPDEHCPHCGSTDIERRQHYRGASFLTVLLYQLPLRKGPPTWHCNTCSAGWPDIA